MTAGPSFRGQNPTTHNSVNSSSNFMAAPLHRSVPGVMKLGGVEVGVRWNEGQEEWGETSARAVIAAAGSKEGRSAPPPGLSSLGIYMQKGAEWIPFLSCAVDAVNEWMHGFFKDM